MMKRPSPAVAVAQCMAEMRDHLPSDWETSGFWQLHADELAAFLATKAHCLSSEDAFLIIGLGAVLLAMAEREEEAAVCAGSELARVMKGGAA